MACAYRGDRVTTAEKDPSRAWQDREPSTRTNKTRWEHADFREEAEMLRTWHFVVVNHYRTRGLPVYFWVTPVGGSRLNLGDIKRAVRDYIQRAV
jgi:hypothetical protein